MKAVFQTARPYAQDAMNLPVRDVDSAIPYYEKTFGFRVESRQDAPHKSVVLARDNIRIGLAENGGDPSQEGCFFKVDNIEAAFEEIKGAPATESVFELKEFAGVTHRVFFVVAPDGLCYMLAGIPTLDFAADAAASGQDKARSPIGATENQMDMRGTIPQRTDRIGTKIEDEAGTGQQDSPGG